MAGCSNPNDTTVNPSEFDTAIGQSTSNESKNEQELPSPEGPPAVELYRPNTLLNAPKCLQMRDVNTVLELKGRLLIATNSSEMNPPTPHFTVALFDLKDGCCVSTYSEIDFPEAGFLYRVEETTREGYDYRFMFEHLVVYCDSTGNNQQMIIPLPRVIDELSDVFRSPGGHYDMNDDSIVWAREDGIWLADEYGEGVRKILSNHLLGTAFPEYTTPPVFGNPRFICGGKKIVAGVFRPDDQIYFGAVICDLSAPGIQYQLIGIDPDYPDYPIEDRYIAVRSSLGPRVLDASTGEDWDYRRQGRKHPLFETADYRTLMVLNYDSMDFDGLHVYLCDISSPDQEAYPILSVQDDSIIYCAGVTEHYGVFFDRDTPWILAINYQS